jgi:hypothetical protein
MTEIAAAGLVDPDATSDDTRSVPAAGPADRPMDDDAEFAELPARRHVPAVTKLLVVGILVAISFAGGVLVQKQHDAGLTSAIPAFAGGAGGMPPFLSGAGGTGAGSSSGGSSSTAVSGPVLVGTVESVSGGDITVKDFGGATHVVHTGATTGLATTGADWSTSLPSGTTVSVEGTKAADGTVTATTVTRR